MRVRNQHPAMVEGIPSGADGEVDATRPGVQGFLRAGLLVAVLDDAEATETIARSPIADAVRGVDTLVGAQARVRELDGEVAALTRRCEEQSAALAAAEAEVARLRADLDAATAPTAATEAPATGRARRNG